MNTKEKFQQHPIEKAMKDPDFRKLLLENPKAVIEAETGIKIPEGINIKVLQEDMQTIYLVLPFVQETDNETELAETEMNSIAGGGRTAGCTAIAAGCTEGGCPTVDPAQCY